MRVGIGFGLGVTRRGVAGLAFGGERQQGFGLGLQVAQALGDASGLGHQFADEAFEVVDQPFLEGHHRVLLGALQFDGARQPGHEGFGIVGEAAEHMHQVAQDFVDFGGVRRIRLRQYCKTVEPREDVVQCHRLQLAMARQGFGKGGESGLHRLAAARQPVQQALAVEILDGGDTRRIRLRFEVAPVHELREKTVEFLGCRHAFAPARFMQDFVAAQMQPELPTRGGEAIHDRAIGVGAFGADMAEQAGGFGLAHALGMRSR